MRKKVLEVAQFDEVSHLRMEAAQQQDRLIRLRAFHCFKCQAMRQKFEDQMKSMRMTLASNRELFGKLGQSMQVERSLASEYTRTAEQISSAELKLEEVASHAEKNKEHRQRLQNWKKNKARQLSHIDKKVRDHERLGTVDIEGMLRELREKTELVQQLRAERDYEQDSVEHARKIASERVAEHRAALMEQREAKDAARVGLERLRQDAERGGLSEEERLRLWRIRLAQIRRRHAELQEENNKLKTMRQAFHQSEDE